MADSILLDFYKSLKEYQGKVKLASGFLDMPQIARNPFIMTCKSWEGELAPAEEKFRALGEQEQKIRDSIRNTAKIKWAQQESILDAYRSDVANAQQQLQTQIDYNVWLKEDPNQDPDVGQYYQQWVDSQKNLAAAENTFDFSAVEHLDQSLKNVWFQNINTLSWAARKIIIFKLNPQNYTLTMNQYASAVKSRRGYVPVYQKAPKKWFAPGTVWEEPTITYQFQSGNIRPAFVTNGQLVEKVIEHVDEGGNVTTTKILVPTGDRKLVLPTGVRNYNAFLELVNESGRILPTGEVNYVKIYHSSPLFPYIMFEGIFQPQDIEVSESANESPNLTWSATLIIKNMVPNILVSGSKAASQAYWKGYGA